MSQGISPRPLYRPAFLQRVFGAKPKVNSVIELNNLLARNGVGNVTIEDVQRIAHSYRVNLHRKFRKQLTDLYQQYLLCCLSDKALSDQEIAELKHLKVLFELRDGDVERITRETTSQLYKDEISSLIADGRLTGEERRFMSKLRSDLKLSEEIATKIYAESAGSLLQRVFDNAISDERLSPEEEKELHAIASNLNVKHTIDDATKNMLDKYKLFWQIENGEIPPLDVGINLQRKERCYFRTPIDWLEQRKVTTRVGYSGPTLRIKIAKGVYWRAGSLGVRTTSQDVWKVIDSGQLYLTSRRLIFMGNRENKTVGLNKILDFTAYRNGVDIQKDTGKSPFLQFEKNVDIFSMMLGRAIQDIV